MGPVDLPTFTIKSNLLMSIPSSQCTVLVDILRHYWFLHYYPNPITISSLTVTLNFHPVVQSFNSRKF